VQHGRRIAALMALVVASSCSGAVHRAVHVARHHASPHAAAPAPALATATTSPPSPPAWVTVGYSVQGRPLRRLSVGSGPRRVLWIGGIHGDEPQGAAATAALPAAFHAAHLERRVSLTILEDANPDGRAANTHDNAHHVDLNRNFPARNFDATNPEYGGRPLSEPESQAVYNLVAATHPNLVIVCHAFRGDRFINYDGPAASLARRFAALSPLPVKRSDEIGYRTPGSLGSFVGIERRVPILTIEWLDGSNPGRDWQDAKQAILAVISSSSP
jgi:protein MpaA